MMRTKIGVVFVAMFASLAGAAQTAPEKYNLRVPNGLAFSDFKGYESWQLVSISQNGPAVAAIFANPVMIKAYQSGIPGNGKRFPDGSKMAKVHWAPVKMKVFPSATVPGAQQNVDFMERDSKRFADSGGWGWAAFEYDAASDTFRPGDMSSRPPQANDAKCGFTCHSAVKTRDYIFTDYAHR